EARETPAAKFRACGRAADSPHARYSPRDRIATAAFAAPSQAAESNAAKRLHSRGCHEHARGAGIGPSLVSRSLASRLMKPAEKPDEKDDRNGNPNQPEQKTATHSVSSVGV